MSVRLRVATFNLENLDDRQGKKPTLAERIAVMRRQLIRLDADILCLQEVNGQEKRGHPRRLLALDKLLKDTAYEDYHRVSTMTADGAQVYNERNLVVVSRFPIVEHDQYKHEFALAPRYQKVTAQPEESPKDITWERPILYTKIDVGSHVLHVINLHLKSRNPFSISGQKLDPYRWKTASGWAEGFFISSMQRIGQALEVRMLIDTLFDADESALIVVCGDFNADLNEVPLEAIRGDVENTGNADLAPRLMVPCERTIPASSRFTFLHRGKGRMIDHLLISRSLLAHYKGSEIHNETLHDESIANASDTKFPEPDHAPVIAEFELPEG